MGNGASTMTSKDVEGIPLKDDPRADPRLVAYMAKFGMDGLPPPCPVSLESTVDQIHEYLGATEAGYNQFYEAMAADFTPNDNVEARTEIIKGVDGNDLQLYISYPKTASNPLPCVYHVHGGMVICSADNALLNGLRSDMAAQEGFVVIGCNFRNASASLGNHPFPAGVNDCLSGLEWVAANKNGPAVGAGVSKVVLMGESGGGLHAAELLMKLKAEGKLGLVDGVYLNGPYLSGLAGAPRAQQEDARLHSYALNDRKGLDSAMVGAMQAVYAPGAAPPQDLDATYGGAGGQSISSMGIFGPAPGANRRRTEAEGKSNASAARVSGTYENAIYGGAGGQSIALCWPFWAAPGQLAGLPPVRLSLYEIDPFLDEGKTFYRKLLAAGVRATCREVLGFNHMGDLNPVAFPDMYAGVMADRAAFVQALVAEEVAVQPPQPGSGKQAGSVAAAARIKGQEEEGATSIPVK